jgi:hypothetical protein
MKGVWDKNYSMASRFIDGNGAPQREEFWKGGWRHRVCSRQQDVFLLSSKMIMCGVSETVLAE